MSPHTSGKKKTLVPKGRLSPWLPWVYLVFYQIIFFYIFSKNKVTLCTNIWKNTRPQWLCVCMAMNDCKEYFLFWKNVHYSSYLSIYYTLTCTLMAFINKNQKKIELTKRKGQKIKNKHLVIDVSVMMIPNLREALAHLLSLIFIATNMFTEII